MRGDVLAASGPWRASGDWWRENPWQEDEWDLEIRFHSAGPGPRPLPFLLRRAATGLVRARNLRLMYIELHARSAFSFLEGSSLPEELIDACAAHHVPAMALLDRRRRVSLARFGLAAKKHNIRAHIGAEVTSTEGWRYPFLVESRDGYQNLCRLITQMKLRARKGEGCVRPEEISEMSGGLVCLTGGDEGPLAHALAQGRIEMAVECVRQLCRAFGRENVYVELQRHFSAKKKRAIRPPSQSRGS